MQNTSSVGSRRLVSLDITRIVAFLCVCGVHFFLHTGYLATPLSGLKMLALTIVRTMLMVCVPLFMLLTGYLYCGRYSKLSGEQFKRHLSKLISILLPYVLSIIVVHLFRKYYLKHDIFMGDLVRSLLSFDYYSWYVEMYIGLFLMIPLLSAAWNMLQDEKSKKMTVGIFLFCTCLPSLLNAFDWTHIGSLIHPSEAQTPFKILPSWWIGIYPITYFYLGAYMHDCVDLKKLKPWKWFLTFLASGILSGLFNFFMADGGTFKFGTWADWTGPECVVMSVLLFLTINSIPWREMKGKKGIVLSLLSECTFSAYLVSWAADSLLYPIINAKADGVVARFAYFPLVWVLVALSSMVVAIFINVCKWLLMHWVPKLWSKHSGRQ